MYSKCSAHSKPSYITDLENQLSNALDGLANKTDSETSPYSKDASASGSDQKQGAGKQDDKFAARAQPLHPTKKTDVQIAEQHFEKSPFADADQLNSFLFWFGVVSAILIAAFIIQCCREVARGEDLPVNLSPATKTPDNPMVRMN